MNSGDYYQTLGMERNASQQQIREAYRRLAFQYHPDRNGGDASATERMKAVNEAYAVLSDVRKRAEYDALRDRYGSSADDRFRQAHTSEDIFSGSDVAQVFEELARMFGFRNADEVFREFYGSGFRSYTFRRDGVSGRGFVFTGSFGAGHRGFTFRRGGVAGPGFVSTGPFGTGRFENETNQARPAPDPLVLPGIRFSKILAKLAKLALSRTLGVQFPEKGRDRKDVIRVTLEQAQKGQEAAYSCHKWGNPRDLMVRIPAGAKDGQAIRLSGMGAPGKGGGSPGDLYLRIRVIVPWRQRVRSFFGRA